MTSPEFLRFLTQQAIPLEFPPLTGWKDVPIKENYEPLVALGPFSDYPEIHTHSIYFGEKPDSPYTILNGSLITMFVRESVAKQLADAQKLLPPPCHLIVFDAYRTLEVQQALYDVFFASLTSLHPDLTKETLSIETQKYVSIPSTNPNRPSPHNTGGAVDLAIYKLPDDEEIKLQNINSQLAQTPIAEWETAYRLEMKKIGLIERHASILNFGTQFDHGGIEASLNFYERPGSDPEIQTNRRLLYNLMRLVSLEPYEDEWWHYNSKKSQMGAKTAGLIQAEYGALKLSPDNQAHETMRQGHWLGSTRIFLSSGSKFSLSPTPNPYLTAAVAGVEQMGDIRKTGLPKAKIIKPEA